jgi:hypothetical protein
MNILASRSPGAQSPRLRPHSAHSTLPHLWSTCSSKKAKAKKSKITAEDAEEFTKSLGQVVGGSRRQIALAKRLGVPEVSRLSSGCMSALVAT